jgi:hypothetical protein
VGLAGILRFGRTRDYVAGRARARARRRDEVHGGIVLLPLDRGGRGAVRRAGRPPPALKGIAIAGGVALAGFVAANPYAVLSFGEFFDGLAHQSDASADTAGKLGLTQDNGILYYLWTFTWGLGWIPALLALGSLAWLHRDEPRLIWVLAPAPIVFLIFMGFQSRFFGRWLIPILPIVCVLAAYLALELADWAARRHPRLRPTLVSLAVIAVCGQGAVAVLHSGRCSRARTPGTPRATGWSPTSPSSRSSARPRSGQARRDAHRGRARGARRLGAGHRQAVAADLQREPLGEVPDVALELRERRGHGRPGPGRIVNIEDYERTLRPT